MTDTKLHQLNIMLTSEQLETLRREAKRQERTMKYLAKEAVVKLIKKASK